jgi:hypothetical protein
VTRVPFVPRLDILPPPQRRLWDEFYELPADCALYGGTAIALHLGHRESIDFDFFCRSEFDPDRLVQSQTFLRGARIVQREMGTLTAQVDRMGSVLVSFFATPRMGQVESHFDCPESAVKVASLIDLAGLKCDVVQKRAEVKDYIDIDALIQSGIRLPEALAAAQIIQGDAFNPFITLKALAHFEEPALQRLPRDLKDRLRQAIRSADAGPLPELAYLKRAEPKP